MKLELLDSAILSRAIFINLKFLEAVAPRTIGSQVLPIKTRIGMLRSFFRKFAEKSCELRAYFYICRMCVRFIYNKIVLLFI
jgi:hypothetical protein